MATTNGSTAIRDKILASLARYRALRIGKFPCAFWRLSARPGLTALEGQALVSLKLLLVLLNVFSIVHRLKYSMAMIPGLIVIGKVVTNR
ncbi:hypothetical protein [Bathymodiolus japonicus methanotrophic gill symbiont]|uniref:hypothetical protein n=1 Tax=Bathymodiolus japonicus methanotrophic gill symbiont TaxID=113269 RepID=UPI001C8E12F1|nr:hypothetical protein [Bathymodiolus japonicus methanotrophic gill symbiont]